MPERGNDERLKSRSKGQARTDGRGRKLMVLVDVGCTQMLDGGVGLQMTG